MSSHNYIGLCIGNPRDDGSKLKEPKDEAYHRLKITPSDWSDAEAGVIYNLIKISFATATEDWGLITHFAVFDAASAGNMLAHGVLSQSKTINNSDTARFQAGDLNMTL